MKEKGHLRAASPLRLPRPLRFGRSNSRAGFTILEVVIASSLMVVGVAALSGSILSGTRLSNSKQESAIAHNAVRATIETLQGETFADVYARYNADPADDPGGAGTAPGPNFAVRGLTTQVGDADGFVGNIQFPDLDLGGGALALREDVADAALGMPRDLNGDGVTDALDHSGDYIVLPVRITLQWRGKSTNRLMVFEHILSPR